MGNTNIIKKTMKMEKVLSTIVQIEKESSEKGL